MRTGRRQTHSPKSFGVLVYSSLPVLGFKKVVPDIFDVLRHRQDFISLKKTTFLIIMYVTCKIVKDEFSIYYFSLNELQTRLSLKANTCHLCNHFFFNRNLQYHGFIIIVIIGVSLNTPEFLMKVSFGTSHEFLRECLVF